MSPPPVFGRRNRPDVSAPLAKATCGSGVTAPVDPEAFFAAARAEMAEETDEPRRVVPLSFKAAFLAGLVVGCGLVGFDLTGRDGATQFTGIASALGLDIHIGGTLIPAMILLGLLGGARTAALNLVVVHTLLSRAGQTTRTAYAIGGGLAATVLGMIFLLLLGHAPAHGWAVDVLAGAAGGLLYRVFAGTRAA